MRDYILTTSQVADILGMSKQGVMSIYDNDKKNLKPKKREVGKRSLQTITAGELLTYREAENKKLSPKFGKTTTFQCQKGGVGKSTMSYNLAVRAAMYGIKVLAVDLDCQAHMTMALYENINKDDITWLHIIKKEARIDQAIIEISPTLHLVPSNLNVSAVEKYLNSEEQDPKTYVLNHINEIKNNYEWIVIDCAPSLSTLNHAATIASDLIIVPVTSDDLAKDGMEITIGELNDTQHQYGIKPNVKILYNKFHQRERLSLSILAELARDFNDLLLESIVRRNVTFKEAVREKTSIFELAPKAPGSEDLDLLLRELFDI